MPINRFDGDLFIRKLNTQPKPDADLIQLLDDWQYLTYWQRKSIVIEMRMYVFRSACREKWQAWRAVIVPAWCDLCPHVPSIIVFLLVIFGR